MIQHYSLHIEDCSFGNLGESTNCAVRGAKNTFADRVELHNCTFRDISGNAVDFGAERDYVGRYNAEDMLIEGCTFENMLGLGINIYRGGSDESPQVPMSMFATALSATFAIAVAALRSGSLVHRCSALLGAGSSTAVAAVHRCVSTRCLGKRSR